jgi:predicted dehydrogenase
MTVDAAASPSLTAPLDVGLIGAGPWAEMVHAPMLAAGPATRLAGVWARRSDAARALAERHGAASAPTLEALFERCEAVAFAVPPDVQAELAVEAARRGKHLLLEKPLALDLHAARRLVAAVDAAGVVSQLVLSYRYRADTEAFLAAAREFEASGARAAFLGSGALGGPFATPWRLEHGALLDLGPHVLDLLEAALGPIATLAARGDPRRWVAIACTHEGGTISDVALSATVRVPETVWRLDLFAESGTLGFDAATHRDTAPWPRVAREFAHAVRTGRPHVLDARHGLRLQELIDRAERSLRGA